MDKIALTLTKSEWQELTTKINGQYDVSKNLKDKYTRALMCSILKQVFIKFHNKLHSLNEAKNKLSLTVPEAVIFSSSLIALESNSYIVLEVIGIIDQKLT